MSILHPSSPDLVRGPLRASDDLRADAVVLLAAAAAAAGAGWVLAQAGMLGLIAGAAGAIGLTAWAVVRDRASLGLVGLTLSLVLLLHKSVGPIADNVHSGAPSINVTTLDVVLVLLYLLWFTEGTLLEDLLVGLRRPVLWLPLVGMGLSAVSIVVAPEPVLAVSELVRMVWMYLLYVYVALRVRTRRDVVLVLGGLGVVAIVQLVVVLFQWRTGGVFGLEFLGVPTELGSRDLDTGQLGRPFGTIVHPVFMGALLGVLGAMALSLAIELRSTRWRLLALGFVPVCVAPMILAHTRAAAVAFGVTAVGLVIVGVLRRRLSWRLLGGIGAGVAVAALLASPVLVDLYQANFGQRHLDLEIESRLELNRVAVDMFEDAPIVGVGLNNFEQVLPRYDEYGLIFAGNPVHNLFLLQLSETGVVGLAGLLLVGVALTVVSVGLARSRDPLRAAVGAGTVAMLVFYVFEEQLGFSLRQEVPLAVFWLLAGLCVAARRQDEADGSAAPPSRWTQALRVGRRRRRRQSERYRIRHTMPVGASLASSIRRMTSRPRRWDPDIGALFRRGRHAPPPPRVPVRGIAVAGVAALALASLVWLPPFAGAATGTDGLKLVFSAQDRATGHWGIYTANGDGSDIRRVTPDDGKRYNWPVWAWNGTRILYTAREGGPGNPEHIYLMEPDGTGVTQLTDAPWRQAQPKMAPDGRRVVFSSLWDEYRYGGLYELDLATSEVRNISAPGAPRGAMDSDPRFTPNGDLVFARSVGDDLNQMPTDIWRVGLDGVAGRRQLTHGDSYDVDPDISPDGRQVVYGSFRGGRLPILEGDPARVLDAVRTGADPASLVEIGDWRLVLRDLASGSERELTGGADCHDREWLDPCQPEAGSAFVPRWTPDGEHIGYVSALAASRVCICVIRADGSQAVALVDRLDLAIDWFDWVPVGGSIPDSAVRAIGADRSPEQLLIVANRSDDRLLRAGRDRWNAVPVSLPTGVKPLGARWSADRELIVFSARTPYELPEFSPHPEPPPGQQRRERFVLTDLQPAFTPIVHRPEVAREQVFLLDTTTGDVEQLTTVWTEDWRDGNPPEDPHGNVDPSLSPDGRFVYFTSVATASDQSAILRLDRDTGEVLNLTNATAGAVPVADWAPRVSPDGSTIAFTSNVGEYSEIFTMRTDGSDVRQRTDGTSLNMTPAWSPDGTTLAFVRYSGKELLELARDELAANGLPLDGWELVRLDLATGSEQVVFRDDGQPAFNPVWSPDGDRIAFVSQGPSGQPDLYTVPATGGAATPLQVTFQSHEYAIDWR